MLRYNIKQISIPFTITKESRKEIFGIYYLDIRKKYITFEWNYDKDSRRVNIICNYNHSKFSKSFLIAKIDDNRPYKLQITFYPQINSYYIELFKVTSTTLLKVGSFRELLSFKNKISYVKIYRNTI